MTNPQDISAKLAKLTDRQCQILFWVCRGKKYKWIAKEIGFGVDTIQGQMTEVYDALELHHLERDERRAVLYSFVCPIHLQEVGIDGAGCSERILAIGEATPDPQLLAMVKRDEREGIIPMKGNLPVSKGSGQQGLSRQGQRELASNGGGAYPPPKSNPLPWVLVGILLTLVVVMAGGIGYYLFNGGGSQPTPSPAATPVVVTVIVTSPPQVFTPPPAVVPVAATPTATSVPVASWTPVIVVAPTATSTPVPPTSTSSPTPSVVLPFRDTFDHGLRPEWVVLTGQPVISAGRVKSTQNDLTLQIGYDSMHDYTVDFDFYHTENHDICSIMAQKVRMCIDWYDTGLHIFQNGQWIEPEFVQGVSGDGRLRIKMSGNTYSVWVNGQPHQEMTYGAPLHGPFTITINDIGMIGNFSLTSP